MDLHRQIMGVDEALRFVAGRTLDELTSCKEALLDHESNRIYWIASDQVWRAEISEDEINMESTRPVGFDRDPFQAGWDHQVAGILWQSNGHVLRAQGSETTARWTYAAAGLTLLF